MEADSDLEDAMILRPAWVQPPTLDALWPQKGGQGPLEWPYWTDEERTKYVTLMAMDTGPDWEPPRIKPGQSLTD